MLVNLVSHLPATVYVSVGLNSLVSMNPQEKAQGVECFVETKSDAQVQRGLRTMHQKMHHREYLYVFGTNSSRRQEVLCTGEVQGMMKMSEVYVRSVFAVDISGELCTVSDFISTNHSAQCAFSCRFKATELIKLHT
jgi:hypothetical protein